MESPSGPPLPQESSAPAGGVLPIVAIAAAVCAGAAVTLLVMTAKPSATPGRSTPAAATPAPPGPAPADASPAWSTKNQARWVSNHRKSAAFEVGADRPVAVWMRKVTPLLVVRCLDRRTDVFVFTDSAARIEPQDDNHTVQIALDGGPRLEQRWPDSVEHDALFAPDGAALARQLVNAETLAFSFSPHNATPVTATFNVRGLKEQLGEVESFCR